MSYFIKLSGTPLPDSSESLSFKIKYDRTQDPTPDNPLKGLFDYTGFARNVRERLSGMRGKLQSADCQALEKSLHSEVRNQGIDQGKYKLFSKPGASNPREARPDVLRLEGRAGGVAINHGHFLEHQMNSATGVSTENLAWVVKLKVPSDHKKREAFESALNEEGLRQEINSLVRNGLEQGDALELVNDAIKGVLQEKLRTNNLPAVPARLALRRPELLPGAVVVVGENTVLQPSSGVGVEQIDLAESKNPERVRKYRDFLFGGQKHDSV